MSNPATRFRVVSLLEGASFVVLLICTVFKYTSSFNGVPVMGPVHGVLFIAYVLLAWDAKSKLGWSSTTFWLSLLASVLPFGPFVFDYAKRDELRVPATA